MVKALRDPVSRGRVALALFVILAVALLGPLVWAADARHLSAYGNDGDDASLARGVFDGRVARVEAILGTPHQLADLKEPTRSLLVVLGAERRYSESESQAIVDFLKAGGNVLISDEGGFANDITKSAGYAIVGANLLDTKNHRGDPKKVVAEATVGTRVFPVLFNQPSVIVELRDANPATILSRSSPAAYPDGSFLDANGNGEIDRTDAASSDQGSFPLIVQTTLGPDSGKLVIVADNGIFMNAQMSLGDYENDAFLSELVASLVPADGLVLIDEGRHAPAALIAPYNNGVRTLSRLTGGAVAPILTLLVLLLATLGAWWATRETEDWSHHDHDLGRDVPAPEDVRPDLERAQRMARHRISEKFNMPLEQVAAMSAPALLSLTGDRLLAEAAAGTLKSDPAPLFKSFYDPSEALP